MFAYTVVRTCGVVLAPLCRTSPGELTMRRLITFVLLCAAAIVPTGRASAQLPIPSLSIVGGVSHWDLSGTGTSPFGAVRVDVPLLFIIGEGSLGIFRAKEDAGTRTYIIPE